MTLPDVNVTLWSGTKKSLHLYAQMLGKLRAMLAPSQPNWMHTSLAIAARGLRTGAIPWRGGSIEGSLDVFSSELVLERSDGAMERIGLAPARPVAEVFADFLAALEALDVVCDLAPVPQEVADTMPMNQDFRAANYDPQAAARWFGVATATAGIYDEWRSQFFGRSGIQLWWGAFDVALLLFNGNHAPVPAGRGYLLTYDLDAEMMNAGFYCGDETTAPFYYGYIFPEPPSAESLRIAPSAASWSEALHEWVLPYDAVRGAADPAALLREFLDSIYALCFSAAGWDRSRLTYVAPKRRHFT